MTTANRLIELLNDAKANLLTVEIKEQVNGEILTIVDTGHYQEKFLSDSLEYLIHRLAIVIDDYRLM